MISRRQAFVPLAAALVVPTLPSEARGPIVPPEPLLPARYDDPLGIGLEGWPYPAPLKWQQCAIAGQPLRMAYMDVPPLRPGTDKPVVLMHGKNFDSSYWAGTIESLTEAGHRVVVPDQIGFNKSAKPDIPYSFDLLAEQTVNLLGALQIRQATLLAHSTGAMLAIRIAAAYPQRVDKLILEAPVGLVDYRRFVPPQALETLVAAEKRRTVASHRAFLRNYFPVLPAKAFEPFVEWRMRVAQSAEYDRFCKAAALTYQMIYREPVRDQYDDVQAPTLMVVGDKDRAAPLQQYAPPEMAAKMPTIPQAAPDAVKEMKQGTLVILPGIGHVPHLEAPDAFHEKVLAFLAS